MDMAALVVMEAPGRTSSYQTATEAGGGRRGADTLRRRLFAEPGRTAGPGHPTPSLPPLGLQLGKWTDTSWVVTGQWSDISMGVAKVNRVQPPQAPHLNPSSKPPGNLIFIEFNVCDEGRPEINFQRWVLVIVDPNQ